MQLGARWQVGQEPHRSVPPTLFATVAECEGVYPNALSWTLTWLEGRPRLALDDVAEVSVDAAGTILVKDLSGSTSSPHNSEDDDDDEWLLGG